MEKYGIIPDSLHKLLWDSGPVPSPSLYIGDRLVPRRRMEAKLERG